MERSIDLVVGMLSILKAGGVYVPLEPAYPSERLAFILQDSGAQFLLTQKHLQHFLAAATVPVIALEDEVFAAYPTSNPSSSLLSHNQMYMIYTSGSTGLPKGVMIEHHAVLHLFQSLRQVIYAPLFPASEQPLRVALNASFAFDSSIKQFVQLLGGHTLYIVSEEIRRESNILIDYLHINNIDVFDCTPAQLHMLLAAGLLTRCHDSLKLVLVGGEAIDNALWKKLSQQHSIAFYNVYGPTECTVNTTVCPITSAVETVSIGEALPGTELHILDSQLQPVPNGEAGELYIGGARLARGYADHPELTAQSFLPHPFSSVPGARLYHTGDYVRLLHDGKLEFLGRKDHQVKVRGYRVELGEVEATLQEHAAVEQAVVRVYGTSHEERQLQAYVVPLISQDDSADKEQLTASQVQDWQSLHDDLHTNSPVADATLNFNGWNSSYTDEPLSQEEMKEWHEQVLSRIRALRPQRVLEIGCGSGLLLFPLARACQSYVGTDISSAALSLVAGQVELFHLTNVRLLQLEANRLPEIEEEQPFDLIVLNSVVQYFPHDDYLFEVLAQVVERLSTNGHLFIGDVRSLPLLEAFHTSVELSKADPFTTKEQLTQRVQRRLRQENELVIDPRFFLRVKQALPRITHVDIRPKLGTHPNEMTIFRYDVVLTVDTPTQFAAPARWLDWREKSLNSERLREILLGASGSILGFTHIPNAYLQSTLLACNWLHSEAGASTAGEFREQITDRESGVTPMKIWKIAHELSATVFLSWAQASPNGAFDAVFVPEHVSVEQVRFPVAVTNLAAKGYSTDPLMARYIQKTQRQLSQDIKVYLQAKLPSYMLPSSITVLGALPLNSHGKIDRSALPLSLPGRTDVQTPFEAPRSKLEQVLLALWQDVLGVEEAGIHDNFFELGGNSLLGAQLINRLQQKLQDVVYIIALFDAPTVALLGKYLERNYPHSIGKLSGVTPLTSAREMRKGSLNRDKIKAMRAMLNQQIILGEN